MNSVAHHILFTLQALGYVALALSLEEHLEAALYAESTYVPCACLPNDYTIVVITTDESAGHPTSQKKTCEYVLKYPIGVVSDELYMTGGYRYD